MDIEKNKKQADAEKVTKNRKTLILLFVMFITPVALAYAAYFGEWFTAPAGSQGELIKSDLVSDIEDYSLIKKDGKKITGKEFETLYWWIIPLDENECDQTCVNLNLYTLNQTYLGLGKEASRINVLAIFSNESELDGGSFPIALSPFTEIGVKAIENTHSKKQLDLPSNAIYLVDPLGNIFMRYPLVKTKEDAPILSAKLRKDILHLYKYSRLG